MAKANTNIRMETFLKATILKIKKGVKENIILVKAVCSSPSLILIHLRFRRFT